VGDHILRGLKFSLWGGTSKKIKMWQKGSRASTCRGEGVGEGSIKGRIEFEVHRFPFPSKGRVGGGGMCSREIMGTEA